MLSWFPENYHDSRQRFRLAASQAGAQLSQLSIDVPGVSDLTIDVAQIGPADLPAVVVSSGLHGVEAPCGAAIQLAWLAALRTRADTGRFVLIHALNPYGYLSGRRFNEDNVDLNRNFLHNDVLAAGAESSDYSRFDSLLNPAYPPKRVDGFLLKALWLLAREGRSKLQNAIVTGQYQFNRGLFFGGVSPSNTAQAVEDNIDRWVADSPEICHIDFHTGLGAYARCQLLVQCPPDLVEQRWYERVFGSASVVSSYMADGSAYQACGAMGDWLKQRVSDRPYRFLTAEFGTYSALKNLGALRAENQAFHFAEPGSAARERARIRLEHTFCPPSSSWRSAVVSRGVSLINQASLALRASN